jgi:hypothetical protein
VAWPQPRERVAPAVARLRRQRLDRQARGRGRIVEDGGGYALLGGLQPGKRAADAHQHGTGVGHDTRVSTVDVTYQHDQSPIRNFLT